MTAPESFSATEQADVCVVGLGYVGLTLAVALAEVELRVIGCEANRTACEILNRGQTHFLEYGLEEGLQRRLGRWLTIRTDVPQQLPPTVIVCVGTPANEQTHQPDLRQLESAVRAIAANLTPDTLVIIRSTLPIGTSRKIVLPLLKERVAEPLLAFAPERTIQGKALEELRNLPQIVGGITTAARDRAQRLFERLTRDVIPVSSIEAAEMVKLICNAHTDLIYGFGNEVALIAESLGIDADEVINAANFHYPRPDLSRPGFVGGSCLTKDPYLLMYSAESGGYHAPMVAAARQLNESIPGHVAQRVLDRLTRLGRDLTEATVLVSGFAYKGQPETDDLRGGPTDSILALLRAHGCRILGHDFVVKTERIVAQGVEPTDFAAGFEQADAVLILNNHRNYFDQNIRALAARMRRPGVIFDVWGVFKGQLGEPVEGVEYMRLGHG